MRMIGRRASSGRGQGASQWARPMGRSMVASLCLVLPAAVAWADGSAKITVVDSQTKKPLAGASIVIEPAKTEIDPVRFNTDSTGSVLAEDLASGRRAYTVSLKSYVNEAGIAVVYRDIKGTLNVVDGQTINVRIELDLLGEKEIEINSKRIRIDVDDTGYYTFRDRKFFEMFPNNVGNNQSLNKGLSSAPGVIPGGVNQLHIRGEQANNAVYYIDGFQLPTTLTGAYAPILANSMIDTVKLRTGGFSASMGGVSGAAIDTKLRSAVRRGNPYEPFVDYILQSETYGSSFGVNLGRQLGSRPAATLSDPRNAKSKLGSRLGYLLSFNRRESSDMFESPQPNRNDVHNSGTSQVLMGKIDLSLSQKSQAGFTFGNSTDNFGIANRTGLLPEYRGLGQGFGFGGARDASAFPIPFPAFGGTARGSQWRLNNDVNQKDDNTFYVLRLEQTVSPQLRGNFYLGGATTKQSVGNNTPGVSPRDWKDDSSIEYKPTTRQSFNQSQFQADLSYTSKERAFDNPQRALHEYKFGILSQKSSGNESYQFLAQSKAADNALKNINDFIGDKLAYNFATNSAPVLFANREATQTSLYVEDTFIPRDAFRINFGFRQDSFNQDQRLRFGNPTASGLGTNSSRGDSGVSPRINVLYQLPKKQESIRLGKIKLPFLLSSVEPTVIRASFNQILTPAGLSQGAIGSGSVSAIPQPVAAQKTDQTDFSIERQLKGRQLVRLATYNKTISNTHAFQQLIEGPQQTAFMMVNRGKSTVSGFEFTYELQPRPLVMTDGMLEDYQGVSGYISYGNAVAKRQVPVTSSLSAVFYPEHDQRHTLNAGIGFKTKRGSTISLGYYYGSGLAASRITLGGKRDSISELNLRIRTRPNLIKNKFGVELGIENLGDKSKALTFDQGQNASSVNSFSGTRFQQGARLIVSLFGKY
jgi:hypothetical protein